MKNILFILAFLFSSFAYSQVEIVTSDKGERWVAYVETFSYTNDGVFMMVGARNPDQNERRMFVGIKSSSCATGFGPLFSRNSQSSEWVETSQVVLSSPNTVADNVGIALCTLEMLDKPRTNRSST